MLDREAWERAGLDALEAGGVEAVAVVPLAAALGVTRGSFYWHFSSREELLGAVVALWEREHSDAVLDALNAVADPRERLRTLLARATAKPSSIFVRLLDAADREPLVAAALQRSERRRLDVLEQAYRECGVPRAEAARDAVLAYAVYVGLAQMLRHDDSPPSPALAKHLADRLVP